MLLTEEEYKKRYIYGLTRQASLTYEKAEENYEASYGCDTGLLKEALERGAPEDDADEEIHAWSN